MEESSERRLVLARTGAFLAGGLPLLIVGWTTSALTNRLSFAVWGLVAATVYAALLRHAWHAGGQAAGAAFGGLAIGWSVFGWLTHRHAEILDLVRRAWTVGGLTVWGSAVSYFVVTATTILAVFLVWLGARRPPGGDSALSR